MSAPSPDAPAAAPRPSSGLRSFVRLVGMLRPYRNHVIAAAVIAWAVVLAQLVPPRLLGIMIDDIRAENFGALGDNALLLVGAGLLVALLNIARRLVSGTISLGLEKLLRERLFDHLSQLSFTFFDRHQTGQLLSRATVDVTQVRFFLGYGLMYFFMHLGTLVVVPIALFLIAPQLALVVYVMMPIILVVSARYSRRSTPVLKEVQQREADVTTAAEENIIGARVVRAFGQEEAQVSHFRELTDRVVGKERESYRLMALYRPMYGLVPNAAMAIVVLLGARLIAAGELTLGEFSTFFFYMLLLTGPLRIVGNLVGRAQRATASGQRLFELLDTREELPVREQPLPMPQPAGGRDGASEVRFEHVSFSYRGGAIVIDDVSLTIEPGSTVALLGPTGCGKTTLSSLVPRFYDPDGGRVLLDGVDLRDLGLRELRRSVGVVNQEPFLFSASVADNLRYGAGDATHEQLWEALRQAQAAEFVERLPDGLDTMIGERGLTLSGGQRQRLAIARALLVNPRVLILDDATASVDSRVEARITSALGSATQGRTTILIAHRPSTIALADHIVIMDRGRIVDHGTHDELIGRNELYQQIYEQRAARREFLLPTGASGDGEGDGDVSGRRA